MIMSYHGHFLDHSTVMLLSALVQQARKFLLLDKELKGKNCAATFYHGTIIRTGISCKNILCYMRDSACSWFIVGNAKIFRSYPKHF